MFNVIKSRFSLSLPSLPLGSLHISGRLPSTVQACEKEAERQWGMGIWVVLLLVVVRRVEEEEEEKERHGWTRGDGRRKKETSEAIISGRAVAVWVCVCVFVISYSSDVADAQLGPITVCRLLMSSHFDKLLNLEWPSQRSNTLSPLSLSASTLLLLISEQKWPVAGDVWVYYRDSTTIYITSCFYTVMRYTV